MNIFVLLSTIDEGIRKVPDVLLPEEADGVHYVVSWQKCSISVAQCEEAIATLKSRADVTLTVMEGRGLCRNRNHAMAVAMELMDDKLADAVFVIADDDERFEPDAFETIRTTYERWPKLDVALFRVRSIVDKMYFKRYPGGLISWDYRPRSYYPCSLEMTFRSRVYHAGLHFDERFGLGSERLCAGEEEIFIYEARQRGLRVLIFPNDIGYTNPATTGDRVLDVKVLRSKGAVYGYTLGRIKATLRAFREAMSLGVRHRRLPWPIFGSLLYGIRYISK